MTLAKAQIASLDMIVSTVIVLLLLAGAVMIFTKISETKEPKAVYGGLIYHNIEDIDENNIAFLHDYQVNETRLNNFAGLSWQKIKNIIYEGTGFGIQDACIFFLNATGPVPFNGNDVLDIGAMGCSTNNPCPNHDQTYVFVKPVQRILEIVNMYVIVCE